MITKEVKVEILTPPDDIAQQVSDASTLNSKKNVSELQQEVGDLQKNLIRLDMQVTEDDQKDTLKTVQAD